MMMFIVHFISVGVYTHFIVHIISVGVLTMIRPMFTVPPPYMF